MPSAQLKRLRQELRQQFVGLAVGAAVGLFGVAMAACAQSDGMSIRVIRGTDSSYCAPLPAARPIIMFRRPMPIAWS